MRQCQFTIIYGCSTRRRPVASSAALRNSRHLKRLSPKAEVLAQPRVATAKAQESLYSEGACTSTIRKLAAWDAASVATSKVKTMANSAVRRPVSWSGVGSLGIQMNQWISCLAAKKKLI